VSADQSRVRPAFTALALPPNWRPAVRTGLRFWAISRVAFLAYGLVLAALIPAVRPKNASSAALWPVTLYSRYDSGHFVHIAAFGYPLKPFRLPLMDGDNDHAFLPGYPIGARWLADALTGGKPGAHSYLVALAVLAWLGAALAAVLIWRLAADEANAEIADRAVIILLAGPYAFFLMASYSEGVFLAFALAAWLAGRRDRWWLAGVMAAGAAIVRINGLFLAAGLVVMLVLAARATGRRIVRAEALALTLPVLATAGYFGWMRATTGRWTTWFEVQERGWARTTTWPWTTFVHSAKRLFTVEPWPVRYQDWLEMVFAALLLLGVVVLFRRRRWPEVVYVGLTAGSLLTSSYYVSIPRSILVCFPLIVLAAEWSWRSPRRWLVAACVTVGVALLVLNTSTFLFNQWAG
jgi:mannosyltransferase PIG-V